MSAYQNGRLPSSALATIPGTSRQVRADLVGGVAALRAAFERRFGKPLAVTDGYRPYTDQERIFRQRYTTNYTASAKIDARRWLGQNWWRKAGYASASTPGQSNHGWGQAIDFGSGVNTSLTSAEHLWMRANAPAFGWAHPAWARKSPYLEPWHWEGVPVNLVSNPIGSGSTGALPSVDTTPIDPLTPIDFSLEEDMIIFDGSGFWLLSGGKLLPLDGASLEELRKADVKSAQITPGDRDRWLAAQGTSLVIVRSKVASRGVALLGGAGGWTGLTSESDAAAFTRAGVPTVVVEDATFTNLAT